MGFFKNLKDLKKFVELKISKLLRMPQKVLDQKLIKINCQVLLEIYLVFHLMLIK